jgi:hypothetical protein
MADPKQIQECAELAHAIASVCEGHNSNMITAALVAVIASISGQSPDPVHYRETMRAAILECPTFESTWETV